jgi:hypothetical protein
MEQNKWQIILHEQCEDPYYEITNGPISLIANCGFVGEDDADEENIFRRIFDSLDQSGINFHSGNPLELKQHIEIQKLKYEMEALQAKCERCEKENKDLTEALKQLVDALPKGEKLHYYHAKEQLIYARGVLVIHNEALSGEGERVKKWWEEMVIEDMPEYVKITGIGCSIIEGSIVKSEGAGIFDDPKFDNYGEPYIMLRDKHFDMHGLTKMNCRNCIPATEVDYLAYLQTTNQLKDGQ